MLHTACFERCSSNSSVLRGEEEQEDIITQKKLRRYCWENTVTSSASPEGSHSEVIWNTSQYLQLIPALRNHSLVSVSKNLFGREVQSRKLEQHSKFKYLIYHSWVNLTKISRSYFTTKLSETIFFLHEINAKTYLKMLKIFFGGEIL